MPSKLAMYSLAFAGGTRLAIFFWIMHQTRVGRQSSSTASFLAIFFWIMPREGMDLPYPLAGRRWLAIFFWIMLDIDVSTGLYKYNSDLLFSFELCKPGVKGVWGG